MIGPVDQVLIWIEDPAGTIYRITRKSGSRYLHEGPAGKQVCSKTGTGFAYQLLTHMVKMEPERFTIIIDHGKELLGIDHMPVISQDFILFLHRQRGDSTEYTERQLLETRRTVDYDQEHGIKTNFISSAWGCTPEEMI
jgi:hypothetical protein